MKVVHQSDILVVGAGPAGASAGICLARAGLDVCVLDRAVFPRRKTCGDAISDHAVALIDNLGAGESLRRLPSAKVRVAEAIFPDGSIVRRLFPDGAPGMVVPRVELDQVLRDALVAAGAQLREGIKARSLTDGPDGFDGAETDVGRFRARCVVGADGAGSMTWRALKRAYPRGRHLALAATAYFELDRDYPHEGVTRHFFEPQIRGGYGWVFPPVGDGRLANVGIYQRADRYHDSDRSLKEQLAAFVARRASLAKAKRAGPIRSWPLPLRTTPTLPSAPGLLICGDAACCIDPLSGEGIFQALRSGVLAAQTVLAALRGGESINQRWVQRYQRLMAKEIGWPSVFRAGVAAAIDEVVARGWYSNRLLRWALRRGYERSKR